MDVMNTNENTNGTDEQPSTWKQTRDEAKRFGRRAAPALALTGISAALTVGVSAAWLSGYVTPWLAWVPGVGLEAAWLVSLAFERRMAAQNTPSTLANVMGWVFASLATAILAVHAVIANQGTGQGGDMAAWLLMTTWWPLAAKTAWKLLAQWEATELTPEALADVRQEGQTSRDEQARLKARAEAERRRYETAADAGDTVATARAEAAVKLHAARQRVKEAPELPELDGWTLPVLGPVTPVRRALPAAGATDDPKTVAADGPKRLTATARIGDTTLDMTDGGNDTSAQVVQSVPSLSQLPPKLAERNAQAAALRADRVAEIHRDSLTDEQAAERFGVTVKTVRRWLAAEQDEQGAA
jgi:hypothetical protein